MVENKTNNKRERIKKLRDRLPWHYTPLVRALYPNLKIMDIRNVVNLGTGREDIIKALEEVANKFGKSKN